MVLGETYSNKVKKILKNFKITKGHIFETPKNVSFHCGAALLSPKSLKKLISPKLLTNLLLRKPEKLFYS